MIQTIPVLLAATVITTLCLRPWRPWHLLWGLLVPILPLMAFFDGIVSNFRTYTVDELRTMTAEIGNADFEWEVGTTPMPNTNLRATYLLGWRKSTSSSRQAV